ncbi:MAG: hypothetical protein Q9M50_00655 [Methylococcales bacterium]|nr:hypothetical protein [Methylococcales bacterium]
MKASSLEQKQKWLAVGLLMSVIALVSALIIYPILSLGLEYREIRRDHIFNFRRYQKTLKKKAALTKNFEIVTKKYSEQNYFYTNETIALASAELQLLITTTIADAGGANYSKKFIFKKIRR